MTVRQTHFVARHEREWDAFGQWLDVRADSPRRARVARGWQGMRDEDVPAKYRRLCQQLALARRRSYSPAVTMRLQELMQRGHNALYRPAAPRWGRALEFLLADFPRLVRAQRGCLWASATLFVLSTVAMYLAVTYRPELIHSLFDPVKLAEIESMYDPAAPHARLGRDSSSDLAMFGYYIANNIGIGFRTFASGLLAGVGSLLVLVFNGLVFGGVAAHLQGIGHGVPFWRFVVGHAAPELTAIVIAGAAGLRLGLDLVAPGQRTRLDALVEGGKVGGRLCIGIFAMLLFAAFVEAFWSSIGWLPAVVKFSVGGVLWTLVLAWLAFGGRGQSVRAMRQGGARNAA
ncbi:MAG: stage II sporulation protein M [Luteimonas sp.]